MFSTGQVVEGAVNYTNAQAVCGKATTGDDPTNGNNQTNLTLPALSACAQPIGPKWVASITNWLCFVIDAAGLQYVSGTVCQNPLLLLNAIIALIVANSGNVIEGPQQTPTNEGAPTPPANTFAANGQYYQENETGNLFGPKAQGAWPSTPHRWGNNLSIGIYANTVLTRYNQFVEIGPSTGASTWITTLMTAVGNSAINTKYIISNSSNVDQTIASAGGKFTGAPRWNDAGGYDTITLSSGQIVIITSDGTNWIIISDNYNYQTGETESYGLVDCNGDAIDNGGAVVTCAEYEAPINPWTTTDVGALLIGQEAYGDTLFPAGSGIPTNTLLPTVGDTLTFAQYNESDSGGYVARAIVASTDGTVELLACCIKNTANLIEASNVPAVNYDIRWQVPAFNNTGTTVDFPDLPVPDGSWEVIEIYPRVLLLRTA